MSKVLVIDTSSKNLYVMLLDGDKTTKILLKDSQKQHSVLLNQTVEDILQQTSTKLVDIGVFAVSIGVGSFTGIRVGVSVAKGFNFLGKAKYIEVNTLQTLAYTKEGRINCLSDAGKGFYYAVYEGLKEITPPSLISNEQAMELSQLPNTVIFDLEEDYSIAIEKQVRDKIKNGVFSSTLTPLYVRRCQAEEERELNAKQNRL